MNILVTGAAGFIGSHLCELLLRHGHTVVGLDNMNQFYDPALKQENLLSIERAADTNHSEFIFYAGDIRHAPLLSQIYREHRIDLVVHLAAMAGVRPSLVSPLLYVEVNELGTATILEEARKAGVRNIIFGSSSSVYGNNSKTPFHEDDPVDHPISPYAATKRAGELLCHVYHQIHGLSVIGLRFFTVYGPRQRPDLAIRKFATLMRQGRKIPVFGDGTQARDFTYIDDILDGVYKAIHRVAEAQATRYEIFNLGESRTVTVNELIGHLEKALGFPADRQELPREPGDVNVTCADITRAREVLGYAPRVAIEAGIARFAEWFLKT